MRTFNYPNFDLQRNMWREILKQAINKVTLDDLIGSLNTAHVEYYDDLGRGFKIMVMKENCSCSGWGLSCSLPALSAASTAALQMGCGTVGYPRWCGECRICIHYGRSRHSNFSRVQWVVQPSLIKYEGHGSRNVVMGQTGITIGHGFPLSKVDNKNVWDIVSTVLTRAIDLESRHEGPPWIL